MSKLSVTEALKLIQKYLGHLGVRVVADMAPTLGFTLEAPVASSQTRVMFLHEN